MKVTVYFGNVRVIVPCGQGDILVRELMDLAITRYKKATGKSQNSVVVIHNLKSSRDDGILYPDDQLNDVADDREQIIAEFEENYSPLPQLNCGDVTSTSSVCTGSPDLYSVEVGSHCSIPYNPSDVEITEDPHPLGVMPLQVRRGSEPALNCLFPVSPTTDPNKRWSTAVVINTTDNRDNSPDIVENGKDDQCVSPQGHMESSEESKISSAAFLRGSGRLSILGNNAETYRWVEAADRQLIKDFNENFTLKPISFENCDADAGSDTSSMSDEKERTVILKNESGPLGIHVVPDYDSKGRDTGLVIQGIEAGGRIDRDGRFHVGDRITEINGKSLQNVNFQTAQEIFKNALKAPQIKLELVRGNNHSRSKTAAIPKKPPPPVYPKPNIAEPQRKPDEEAALVEGEERAGGISTKVATVTPTKKVPASATRRLASANTRKIGRMLTIELTKGSSGLGFSITTRDNPAGGNSPIYIKNVLPKGAAIEDGRLQPGDRLLEVNGIPMTGKTQADAVTILRNIPLGNAVQMIVSRQNVDESETTENENESTSSKLDEETGIFPWKHREILTFQIPLIDSHSAGLGVSVKGKSTSTANGSVDLGIFIKSVIAGGAASKDGRLQTNDQLVNINGISLLGMSNSNAMETLRNAMTQSEMNPIRNAIILTIARQIFEPSDSENNNLPQMPEITASAKDLASIENCDAKERLRNFSSNVSRTNQIIAEFDAQLNDASPPGCNPVIERLTGQVSVDMMKSSAHDIYGYSKHGPKLAVGDNAKMYSATLSSSQNETVIIEGEYDPTAKKVDDSHQTTNGHPEPNSVAPAGSLLSLDEANPGFARDGFGRQSMSEKRHAQLDARNTDTYQRTKKAREDKDRLRQQFEAEYLQNQNQGTNLAPVASKGLDSDEVLGPSLGLRKSSSLESLQTMIQELNKDDEAMKRAYQSGTSRSSRSRGCNESFRAAVDRSYDAPVSPTMETLDEESESGSSVGHVLARSAELPDSNIHANEDPFQDELLSMYCRSNKSSKKKSLLKGLGSVFKFGKNRKHSQDLKGKDDDSIQDDVFQSHSSLTRDQDRLSDAISKENDVQKRQLPQIPIQTTSAPNLDGIPNRQERMQSLREQYQRMHQKRQGHYPLDQKEEYYENELKEKESKYAFPVEVVHSRSHSLDIYKESAKNHKMPAFTSDPNRYSHYMNYKEIQQHINQRVQHHDQVRSSVTKMKSEPKVLPPPVPDCPPMDYEASKSKTSRNPNFMDYESMHHVQKHSSTQSSDISSNSLPRGSHTADQALAHTQAPPVNKTYFVQNSHDHGNYGHMSVHPFYSNNKLYSHIVPGSKV